MGRRAPLVMQTEQADCGLAALLMIARYHGHDLDLGDLRRNYGEFDRGPTLSTILNIAEALGLHARPVRIRLSELQKLALPAVLHWRFDHFVVLERTTRGRYVILDPAHGNRVMDEHELDESFTGVAVEFTPAAAFRRPSSGRHAPWFVLAAPVRGVSRYIGQMLLLMLVVQLLSLAPPLATQLLIDEFMAGQDRRWLLGVLAGTGLVMLAGIGFDALQKRIALYAGTRLSIDSASAVIAHVLRLPRQVMSARSVGDVVARIDSLQLIRRAVTGTAVDGLVQCIVLLTSIAAMLLYSVPLTLVSFATLGLIAMVYATVLPRARRRNLEAVVHGAAASGSLIDSLRGFASVDALDMQPQRHVHWKNAFIRSMDGEAGRARLSIGATAAHSVIAAADHLVFLGLGLDAIGKQQISLGALFALFALRARLGSATASLVAAGRELYLMRTHVERVCEVLAEPRVMPSAAAAIRTPLRGALRCRSLSFSYSAGAQLLEDINCDLGVGEHVCICGPSGAGKSTLLRLLSLSLPPSSGRLWFDDVEAVLWASEALRAQFGIVMQGDRLFAGSIAQNITGFEAIPDLRRVRDAALRAAVWDDIAEMPMHVHTPVGAAGHGLSAGQLQRIIIARALYRRPRILFLDEATAHLDAATEERVLDGVSDLGITTVSVAHREGPLARSDRQIILPRRV